LWQFNIDSNILYGFFIVEQWRNNFIDHCDNSRNIYGYPNGEWMYEPFRERCVAAPKAIPSAPVVTVVNNCGSSILTATSFTGSLLWSNGATTSSITVTTAGTYTVAQTGEWLYQFFGKWSSCTVNLNSNCPYCISGK
jgi:hypothetical protein